MVAKTSYIIFITYIILCKQVIAEEPTEVEASPLEKPEQLLPRVRADQGQTPNRLAF